MASRRAGSGADLPLPAGFTVQNKRISYYCLPEDYDYIGPLAQGRDDSYPGPGDPKRRARDREGTEIHMDGLKGEYVVSQFYGLSIDETLRATGDDGEDFRVLFDGEPTTIDVKATTISPPWLQTMETNTDAEYYFGVYVDGPLVQFLGMVSREELLAGEYGRTTGKKHYNYKLTESEIGSVPIPDRITAMPADAD